MEMKKNIFFESIIFLRPIENDGLIMVAFKNIKTMLNVESE